MSVSLLTRGPDSHAQDDPSTDFAVYAELRAAAESAHELLLGASDANRTALRTRALASDVEALEWLDRFIQTDVFAEIPGEAQALAIQDRFRLEYNYSTLLVAVNRCADARDRIRSLLDSTIDDSELRPRLISTYDDAVECINHPRSGRLVIDCDPSSAELLIDGEYFGRANIGWDVSLGQHRLLLRAEGYRDHEIVIVVNSVGEQINVGPIQLTDSSGDGPAIYEWIMWGVGVVGIGVGTGYLVWAGSREQELDDLESGSAIILDPEGERAIIDDLRTVGYLAGSIGLASAIAGTVSYIIRDRGDGAEGLSVLPGVSASGPVLMFDFRF